GMGFSKDYGIEKKAWYDVPGQVGNFAKWMGSNLIQTAGMNGGLKALQAVGAVGGLNISKVFQGSLGRVIQKTVASNKRAMPNG
ncbi:hypothetical protein ACI3PL_28060, partial [Lacticaseibacillus paracasei]